MLQEIFTNLGEIITQFSTLLVDVFKSVTTIFYTPGAAEAPGELTIVGILALISVGVALVMWGFNFILRLLKFR